MAREWHRLAWHLSQPTWEEYLTWTAVERRAHHDSLSDIIDAVEEDAAMRQKDMRR